MREEDHKISIQESLDVLKESIQLGLEPRQRTIGFHCSAAAADLLELYLHQINAIDPGKTLKHDFFSSERKALEKIHEDFPEKVRIIKLMVGLESLRNQLCYGKRQPKEKIEQYVTLFNSILALFEMVGVKKA